MNRSLFGYAAAYAVALATGTSMLIGALGSHDAGRVTASDPRMTRADMVMQQTAEQGVKPDSAALLVAAGSLPNDKRGY